MILYAVVSLDPDGQALTVHHVKPYVQAKKLADKGRCLVWVKGTGFGVLDLNKSVRPENVEWSLAPCWPRR